MNQIDDMFRDGLNGRKAEVPADMWSRVRAGKTSPAPEGEGVDQYFADALKDRAGEVPTDMWSRISAAGVLVAAGLDQVFADGLRNREGTVPAGMWDRIWKARTAAPVFTSGRVFGAVAAILLLLSFGWWMLAEPNETALLPAENASVVAAPISSSKDAVSVDLGAAAGANTVERAGPAKTAPQDNNNGPKTTASVITETAPTFTAAQPQQATASTALLAARVNATVGNPEINPAETKPTSTTETLAANPTPPTSVALPALVRTQTAIAPLDVKTAALTLKNDFNPSPLSASSFRAANRYRLQTEFLFGAFYANQQFSADTEDLRAQRNIREVRENPGLSYQVSLRGAYKLNERLVLRSGLTYSEIRNKFDYEDIVNGSAVLLTTNNHIRQLEVPVLMGFHIPGRRLNVSLNAGPLVNLTTSVQGRFLHPDSATPLSLADDGQYRRNVGVGFMTSLSTTYVIGKKQPFVLLVEPFFKAYPGSFTAKNAPLKETYWAAGLQLGVRKGF